MSKSRPIWALGIIALAFNIFGFLVAIYARRFEVLWALFVTDLIVAVSSCAHQGTIFPSAKDDES